MHSGREKNYLNLSPDPLQHSFRIHLLKILIMKKNESAIALLKLGFIGIIFLAIQIHLPGQTKIADLTGNWERQVQGTTLSIVIGKDGAYKVEFTGDGIPDVNGTCKLEKDRITFQDTGGRAALEPGIYSFKLQGKEITFEKIDDPSNGRSSLLQGTWTRKEE